MRAPDHAERLIPAIRRHAGYLAILALVSLAIFAIDVVTPAEEISPCFLYVIPILMLALRGGRLVYAAAVATTLLSVVGAFIQTPDDVVGIVFIAGRAIAIFTQWIVAAFVMSRSRTEALVRSQLADELQKATARYRFLDVLSHEIGTSLTTIDGQAFRMQRRADKAGPDEIADRAGRIRAAANHIVMLVDRVHLAIESDKIVENPVFKPINLGHLLTTQFSPETYGDRIRIDIADLPETFIGDRIMVVQILDNIVSNALKYSESKPVEIRSWGDAQGIVVRVRDQGRGIPADERSQIFDKYYRAKNSRGIHGAGIGLYVSKRFAELHGGSIAIDSAVDRGTTVTIHLPIMQRERR